jgi:benzoyl-CoA reductase/2-hydroxyglutaryl-CoA dehydratase subunit BcrC/BadD/HgdB
MRPPSRYFNINCAIYTPNPGRIEDVLSLAKTLPADGIIDCSLQFCMLYDWSPSRSRRRQRMRASRICTSPRLLVEDAGQLTTRIEAFIEMI